MRRAVALLLLIGVGALCAQTQSPGYAAYRRADALFVAQRFTECQAEIDAALRLDPKLVPALTLQAKLALAGQRFDVARQSLERALDADPRSAYARFLYGFQFYLANELQLALPQFEKAHALDSSDPRAALYLGMTRESLGQNDAAMSLYQEAVRLERARGAPQSDTFLTGARLLSILGRNEECGRWIGEALKLAPESRDAHFERARLLLRTGDARAAAEEGETALRLAPDATDDNQIRYLLLRAYRDSGQPERAAQQATRLRQ